MPGERIELLGVGSALLDVLASVEEGFLRSAKGDKGGMLLIDGKEMEQLCTVLPDTARQVPGGSAANTIMAASQLGLRTAFLGKTGEDQPGQLYRTAMESCGVNISSVKTDSAQPTGRCCSLVTPDSERTMRTFLGASALLKPEELQEGDFTGAARVHIEGYILFNRELFMKTVKLAKNSGALVSLDLASFEVVEANREVLPGILKNYVDLIFANETEAEAYTGQNDPEKALDEFTSLCSLAAVKLGPDGAWISNGKEKVQVPAQPAEAIDTTGAGDLWAAGFLWGLARGLSLAACGAIGALLGAEVVQVMGAQLPEDTWSEINQKCRAGQAAG